MKHLMTGLVALSLSVSAVAATAASNPNVDAFIASFDTNSDGQITLAEAEDRRTRLFAVLDRDRDNQLTREELVRRIRVVEQTLSQQGIDKTASSQSIDQLMAAYDKDGSGTISLAEYNAGLPQWFAFRDRNKDGVITAADARGA